MINFDVACVIDIDELLTQPNNDLSMRKSVSNLKRFLSRRQEIKPQCKRIVEKGLAFLNSVACLIILGIQVILHHAIKALGKVYKGSHERTTDRSLTTKQE